MPQSKMLYEVNRIVADNINVTSWRRAKDTNKMLPLESSAFLIEWKGLENQAETFTWELLRSFKSKDSAPCFTLPCADNYWAKDEKKIVQDYIQGILYYYDYKQTVKHEYEDTNPDDYMLLEPYVNYTIKRGNEDVLEITDECKHTGKVRKFCDGEDKSVEVDLHYLCYIRHLMKKNKTKFVYGPRIGNKDFGLVNAMIQHNIDIMRQ